MEHKYMEYLAEVDKAIDELTSLRPTAERARCMHDYLYIKKHLMMHMGHDMPMHEAADKKSYFGG